MNVCKAIILTTILLLSSSCSSENDSETKKIILGKYEFSDGWVRPATEGSNSAAYLRITNGTASNDTLVKLTSNVAEAAEIHETVEKGDVTEMLPVDTLAIESGTSVTLEPGGKHIMLIQLNRTLAVGDTVQLNFEYSQTGTWQAKLPVRLQE